MILRNLLKFGLAASLLALLAACGGGGGGGAGAVGGGTITINSFSGAGVSADGTWTVCFFDSGAGVDTMDTQVASGTTLTISAPTWSSTDQVGEEEEAGVAVPSKFQYHDLEKGVNKTIFP